MYSEHATAARRCRGTNRDGSPCRGFACWGDDRCHRHGGRKRYTKPPTCRCIAYRWPHRPGGGLCRWPDPPLYRRTTPPGTHSDCRRRRGSLAEAMASLFGPGRPPCVEGWWQRREWGEDDEDEDWPDDDDSA